MMKNTGNKEITKQLCVMVIQSWSCRKWKKQIVNFVKIYQYGDILSLVKNVLIKILVFMKNGNLKYKLNGD